MRRDHDRNGLASTFHDTFDTRGMGGEAAKESCDGLPGLLTRQIECDNFHQPKTGVDFYRS